MHVSYILNQGCLKVSPKCKLGNFNSRQFSKDRNFKCFASFTWTMFWNIITFIGVLFNKLLSKHGNFIWMCKHYSCLKVPVLLLANDDNHNSNKRQYNYCYVNVIYGALNCNASWRFLHVISQLDTLWYISTQTRESSVGTLKCNGQIYGWIIFSFS